MPLDLQDVIDSKIDTAVLGFFLMAPIRSYSSHEVGKRLRLPLVRVNRSLNNFARTGQLYSFTKRGKRYFLYNSRHKLLPEIRGFVLKNSRPYHDDLFSAVKKVGKIRAAFLSGLFTGYPNLPVDILLVGRVNLKRLDAFIKTTEKLVGQEINYSIMSTQEFLERRDTFDKFIKDIFDYRHLVIIDNLPKKKSFSRRF